MYHRDTGNNDHVLLTLSIMGNMVLATAFPSSNTCTDESCQTGYACIRCAPCIRTRLCWDRLAVLVSCSEEMRAEVAIEVPSIGGELPLTEVMIGGEWRHEQMPRHGLYPRSVAHGTISVFWLFSALKAWHNVVVCGLRYLKTN